MHVVELRVRLPDQSNLCKARDHCQSYSQAFTSAGAGGWWAFQASGIGEVSGKCENEAAAIEAAKFGAARLRGGDMSLGQAEAAALQAAGCRGTVAKAATGSEPNDDAELVKLEQGVEMYQNAVEKAWADVQRIEDERQQARTFRTVVELLPVHPQCHVILTRCHYCAHCAFCTLVHHQCRLTGPTKSPRKRWNVWTVNGKIWRLHCMKWHRTSAASHSCTERRVRRLTRFLCT